MPENQPKPKIAIVIGSTRQNRFGDKPAHWLHGLARARPDAAFEVVDLRDYPLPFFDEPASPIMATPTRPEVAKWAAKVAEFDGYVFVTPEYNHSFSAVLKNALDYVYPEFNRKPAAFVAYGNAGGARAVEQLRLVCVELQMAPLRVAVHIGRTEFIAMLRDGKTLADFPEFAQAAEALLTDLVWWTNALKTAR
ncbi:MAG TPA: NAD(P)H-dependent oxidoreductase [Asticcacaulis sp.]|nr:NAD(P)H-dependent oxidoreductase [Asticcacaulis sp.]